MEPPNLNSISLISRRQCAAELAARPLSMLYQQERANKGLLMDVLALRNAARSVRERQLTKTIKPTVRVHQGKVVGYHFAVH